MRKDGLGAFSNLFVWAAVVAAAAWGAPLHASPITLDNGGGHQSTVAASASDGTLSPTQASADVDALPYTTPETETVGTSTSTTTPDLSTSALNFSYSQSITDGQSLTNGEGDIFFTAGLDTMYSISGLLAANGIYSDDELRATLTDLTTAASVYSYDQTNADSLTLDSTGGPLTGGLNAGDLYEFDAYESLTLVTDPITGLTGNAGVSFAQAVPEPNTWATIALGLPLAFLRPRTRRAS